MAIVRSAGAAVCLAAAVLLPSTAAVSFAEPSAHEGSRAARERAREAEAAAASKPLVTLAEVASGPAEGSTRLTNLGELLRHDVEAEIAAVNWKAAGLRRRYTLSAAVVRLSSARKGERAVLASCTVSTSVRDAERGTLLAIVEGRARAEDAPNAERAAERDALAGAVRGAISALPEAIRNAQ
jgi:hypothetical protein